MDNMIEGNFQVPATAIPYVHLNIGEIFDKQ